MITKSREIYNKFRSEGLNIEHLNYVPKYKGFYDLHKINNIEQIEDICRRLTDRYLKLRIIYNTGESTPERKEKYLRLTDIIFNRKCYFYGILLHMKGSNIGKLSVSHIQ